MSHIHYLPVKLESETYKWRLVIARLVLVLSHKFPVYVLHSISHTVVKDCKQVVE